MADVKALAGIECGASRVVAVAPELTALLDTCRALGLKQQTKLTKP